ncbi:MAG: PCRF domain-containing protein, partial [Kyrpidia sp.]|nr:PCRF domain-containing protein [Kyrpidia sp.]
MWDKLRAIEERYEELSRRLCDPDVLADPEKLKAYSKEQADLDETVQTYRQYKQTVSALRGAKDLFEERLDDEMREWVKAEVETLSGQKEQLEARLQVLLLPRDPNDDKNVIVEIRGAAGGEEASLFAADLFRMYTRYAERQGWRVEMIDAHPTDLGGFKEVIFTVQGRGAYSRLKFESGAHRVQRVPTTESGG